MVLLSSNLWYAEAEKKWWPPITKGTSCPGKNYVSLKRKKTFGQSAGINSKHFVAASDYAATYHTASASHSDVLYYMQEQTIHFQVDWFNLNIKFYVINVPVHADCSWVSQLYTHTERRNFCLGIFKHAYRAHLVAMILYAILKYFYISTDMKYREV